MPFTPNLNLEKPTVGADADMWGTKLNSDLDILDQKVFDKTTGGTVTGPVDAQAISGTTVTASTQFSGPATGLTGTAAGLSIGGSAATATTATNVSGGTASVTSLSSTGNTTLGDAGTDTTTLNSQLLANGTSGLMGQYLTSRGPDLSPEWATAPAADIFSNPTTLAQAQATALSF